jgi:rfaE bifunctional protein nucleotidyltransferase chain/domain
MITTDRQTQSRPVVVFTCGVFDLFHYGHLHFLQQARELGDMLIVGINGDEHATRTRGPGRPIYPLRERMQILTALECVDKVVPFFESDPCKLISRIKPDIVAKGDEYNHDNAPEAALIESLGGRFVTIESLPIHSSEILQRLTA